VVGNAVLDPNFQIQIPNSKRRLAPLWNGKRHLRGMNPYCKMEISCRNSRVSPGLIVIGAAALADSTQMNLR
jgi:hypothetical protein